MREESTKATKREKRRRKRRRQRIRQQQSEEAIGVKEVECTRFGTDLSDAVKDYLEEVRLPLFVLTGAIEPSFRLLINDGSAWPRW